LTEKYSKGVIEPIELISDYVLEMETLGYNEFADKGKVLLAEYIN